MKQLRKIKAKYVTTGLHRKLVKPLKNKYTMSKIKLYEIGDMLVNRFGVKYGDTIIVHTSYRHISSCDYDPEDIIHMLKAIVGSKGNIIMPSFRRKYHFYKQIPFDIKNTIGRSGLVNEIFRMYPDTYRSLHPWKSCVAWGNDAKEIVKDHYKSERAFDMHSPYYKAFLLKGKYVGIGVDLKFCSFFHTVEDTNVGLFNDVYDEPIFQTIIDADGVTHSMPYRHISKLTMSQQSIDRVTKYLDTTKVYDKKTRKVPFSFADLEYMYKKLVELAKIGISIHGINSIMEDISTSKSSKNK